VVISAGEFKVLIVEAVHREGGNFEGAFSKAVQKECGVGCG